MRTVLVLLALSAVVTGVETPADAQSCTETAGTVAQVATSGAKVTIKVVGAVPKVNGVSCGFAASAIEVVGVAGNDTVILDAVPASVPVSLALGAGTNNLKLYASTGDDMVIGTHARVDRNGDGAYDLDVGGGPLAAMTLYGRAGDDVIDCSRFDYKVKIYGGAGNDELYGGPANDTLDGGDGEDVISGGAGNDRIDGGFGNDIVAGDDGNDTLVAKGTFDGNDTFNGGLDTDVLTYANRTTQVLAGALAGAGNEDVIAEDVETIKGGKKDDIFSFYYAAGPHNYFGGPGNDWIQAGPGANKIYGEAGDDYLSPGTGPEVIDAGDGNDTVVWTVDAFAETVKCGAGIDNYIGSPEDTFVGCENPFGYEPSGHIATGLGHTCAILNSGELKCWGANGFGQLGQGTHANRGNAPGHMGVSLPATDLGAGPAARAVAGGQNHTCALRHDGSVKCWGWNEYGQLGLGDVAHRGDEPGEMGDALPSVDLGTGRTATAIAAGGTHSCAILDDGSVKCWGLNDFGQLGLGDTASRGDEPGEMGDALPAVDLGTGRTAASIDANHHHTCAVLDDGSVKCWGAGAYGYLGQGDGANRGDHPGEMGDALPPIALGTGRTALEVSTGLTSTCAILDDRTVKCWGYGLAGALGYGDEQTRGDEPGEMGDALPVVPLGYKALTMASGAYLNCAAIANGTMKCWGGNIDGSAGQGSVEYYGDQPGELAAMPSIAIASAHGVTGVATSGLHTCALLHDLTMKCWGYGEFGALGTEDGADRGDGPGEMGDALPFVNVGGPLWRMPEHAPAPSANAELGEEVAAVDSDSDDDSDAADADADDDAADDDADTELADGGCSTAGGGGSAASALLVLVLAIGARRGRARLSTIVGVAVVGVVVAGAASVASAQVCTESLTNPGVAEIATNGVTVTIHMAGSVPKVNGVSCGFNAGAIEVIGVAGKDSVTLNYVPPWIAVGMQLGAGTNNVTVYLTNSADRVICYAGAVDRDDDGVIDLDFGASTPAAVSFYARGGDDLVDCSSFDSKAKIYGGPGNDTIFGGPFNDTIDGGDQDDFVHGGAGNDRLDGGLGNDTVHGDAGTDTLVAKGVADGADHFTGGPGSDNLAYSGRTAPVTASVEGAGIGSEDEIADDVETIKGGKANDVIDFSNATLPHNLWGGPGNDTLRGGPGGDKLYGEAGEDFVVGGGARDLVLDGGDGNDSMGLSLDGFAETVKCGAGTDTYAGNPEDTFKDCETPGGVASVDTIAIGVAHSCAILTGGVVKCWGYSGHGQTGHGDTIRRGDDPGEMGTALAATDLGTGAVAVAITAGWEHTCALLSSGQVKCWGYNGEGELGLGDTENRGDQPGEMGNALPAVDLGPGRTALAIGSNGLHTCAVLDDHRMKCWGWNLYGQLGLGDTANRGDDPGEMGSALPAVDLGTGRTAASIDPNYYHSCAVLDDASVKCWGSAGVGLLGQPDGLTRGDEPGEMGDALPVIQLGTGRTAIAVSTAQPSNCAILDDRSVKCWGGGWNGQLGYGDTDSRGDGPGEMGDALPTVPLGRMAVAISSGLSRHCATLDNGTAKCWGWNEYGALGLGDTSDRGDEPGELASMPAIALGTGRTVVGLVTADGYHSCAKLDNSALKCWGAGGTGNLGLGDGLDRGDGPGEMGDALPAVDLGGLVAFAPAPMPSPLPSRIDDQAGEAVELVVEEADGDVADDFDDRSDDGVDPEPDADDDVAAGVGCSSSRGGSPWLGAVLAALALSLARTRRRRAR